MNRLVGETAFGLSKGEAKLVMFFVVGCVSVGGGSSALWSVLSPVASAQGSSRVCGSVVSERGVRSGGTEYGARERRIGERNGESRRRDSWSKTEGDRETRIRLAKSDRSACEDRAELVWASEISKRF